MTTYIIDIIAKVDTVNNSIKTEDWFSLSDPSTSY